MPHLVLKYTRNLAAAFDVPATLSKLNRELDAIGEFQSPEIKSRALPLDTFVVGITPQEQGFIHIEFSIMEGRSPQIKRQVCERLRDAPAGWWLHKRAGALEMVGYTPAGNRKSVISTPNEHQTSVAAN